MLQIENTKRNHIISEKIKKKTDILWREKLVHI